MCTKLTHILAATLVLMLSASQALANCGLPLPWSPPCRGGSSVPEIDGTAGIMALALLASVVGLLYNRARK